MDNSGITRIKASTNFTPLLFFVYPSFAMLTIILVTRVSTPPAARSSTGFGGLPSSKTSSGTSALATSASFARRRRSGFRPPSPSPRPSFRRYMLTPCSCLLSAACDTSLKPAVPLPHGRSGAPYALRPAAPSVRFFSRTSCAGGALSKRSSPTMARLMSLPSTGSLIGMVFATSASPRTIPARTASSSDNIGRFASPLSRPAKATPPNGRPAHRMSSGPTARPSASQLATHPFTWHTGSSPFFLSTSRLPPSLSPTLQSHSQPPTSSRPVPANLSCVTTTSPPSETTSSSLALPPHNSLNASMRTPSWHTTLSLATLSSSAIQVQSQTSGAKPSCGTLGPWSFSGGPTTAHTTLPSWTVQFPNYTMPPSILSHTSHTHKHPFQSPAYSTVMTLPSWSMTLLMMTLSKMTTRLDWGRSKFQPPGRCKVSCATAFAQHLQKGESVTPTQSPCEPHLLMSTSLCV